MGRFEEAIAPARKALEIEPEDPFLHEHLGFVLTRAGQAEEGEQQDPPGDRDRCRDRPIPHDALGDSLMRQRHSAEAVAAFREAARLEPDDPHLIRRLGSALLQAVTMLAAEAAFRQALTLREEAGPHIEVGRCADAARPHGGIALGEAKQRSRCSRATRTGTIRIAHVLLQLGSADGGGGRRAHGDPVRARQFRVP